MMNLNKLQKLLCLLLSLLLLAQAPLLALAEDGEEDDPETAAAETEEEVEFPDELIVGHPTVTKGDFFTELFGNDTADIDVRALIHGYNLVNWDQNQGTYVVDPSVVTAAQIGIDADGNKTYMLIIADDLKYSDGTEITAWDYAFSILLMMSPEVEAIGGKIYRAEHLMGYDDYIAARRKVLAGETIDPAIDIPYLSGVHVVDDHQIWISLDADFLPYFFETGLLMTVPYPISVIAPGCKVYDNGLGIYIGNADENSSEDLFTPELLRKTILDPETGYNSHPSVVSGPYKLISWDESTGECHFEINPYFKGAWMHNNLPGPDYSGPANYEPVLDEEGNIRTDANGNEIWLVKPTIERICFQVASNDEMIDKLINGELHLVNKVTYGPTIVDGRSRGQEAGIQAQPYPRIGLAFLTFTYEWPTVNDMHVRQAIAYCMDRDLLTSEYCGDQETGQNFGFTVDGYYGIEQWEYQLITGQIGYPVNMLGEVQLPITALDADGNPISDEELQRRYTNMYARTDHDYEVMWAAWEALTKEWLEGNPLTHYTVNLDEAERLLKKAGFTLNSEGEEFRPGVDEVRCKRADDGTLVALDLKMLMPLGNHMKEFMEEEGNFIENLAKVGIKLTIVEAPMEELLKAYYRQTERTTDMIYLATNFHVIVDPSITYSTDDTLNHEIWNNTYSDDEELFYLAKAMRKTEPGAIFEYVGKWVSFQHRYNEVLPTIPIYSNIYYDFFNPYLQNYHITGQVTWSQAILPAYFALEDYDAEYQAQREAESAGEEDGDAEFDD